jgi:hypothetical protein
MGYPYLRGPRTRELTYNLPAAAGGVRAARHQAVERHDVDGAAPLAART